MRMDSKAGLLLLISITCLFVACMSSGPRRVRRYGWWKGLGPVLPHESFPTDCSLCHLGQDWQSLKSDFSFDHERETGVKLEGAHAQAACLRCHNDRGPVDLFAARGCAGCHEQVHQGALGPDCESCHQQESWRAVGQFERHDSTSFALIAVHAITACRRCHP